MGQTVIPANYIPAYLCFHYVLHKGHGSSRIHKNRGIIAVRHCVECGVCFKWVTNLVDNDETQTQERKTSLKSIK